MLVSSVTAPSMIPIRPDAGEHRDPDHRVLLIVAMARDAFSLEGKVAFVTGGNSGLGLAVALSLCDAGARVAVAARHAARNADALASLGPSAAAFTVDVTDEASVERALAGTVERFGSVDILVNNAGISQRASVMDLDRATAQATRWSRTVRNGSIRRKRPLRCLVRAAGFGY